MALNCKISTPISAACETNVSGVLKVWFANWDEAHTFTASEGCAIDTIDLGSEKFYPIAVVDNTASATADLTVGSSNDSKYINHTVSGTIAKLDCGLLGDYKNFLLGTVVIAVLTKNREVFIFGADNGLTATTFAYATGAAEGDANGVSFVFEGAQPNAPLKVKDASVIKALEA